MGIMGYVPFMGNAGSISSPVRLDKVTVYIPPEAYCHHGEGPDGAQSPHLSALKHGALGPKTLKL